MLTGQLWLFNKTKSLVSGELHYTRSVALDITGTFNIEDNLNDTPSNAKFKTVTTNTYREEFEVNTIAYHQDTDSWWVIKSDESTYINTGEYEHEIQLVELLEFYSYKHLPNCAFAPNTYTLEQMLQRLFKIGKQDDIALSFPTFLDEDKIMPFMSFENYTIANAIKNIARSINAIPKLQAVVSFSSGPAIWKVDNFILTFVNRAGLDTPIENGLNSNFPVAFEKNMNSSDQFLTRSVSNIQNAKSSNPIFSPIEGGYISVTPNSLIYDQNNAKVFLPSKIDSILFLNVYVPVFLSYYLNGVLISSNFKGYYTDKEKIEGLIDTITFLTSSQKTTAKSNLPFPDNFYTVTNFGTIDASFTPSNGRASLFDKKMIVKSKFEFDTTSDQPTKDRTAYWIPFTNELIMPESFRNGLTSNSDHNPKYLLLQDGNQELFLETFQVKNFECLIQAYYYPIADIKVSIDNDNEAQDEKFFNQSGKIIDAVSVSKLITSHTNDSVEGTKIRNARYQSPDEDFSDILPLGQIVRDNNQLYVISQRSIDANVRNGNEYYNVIYTLSRNRVARSENIVADSGVISYKTPDDNLVFRNQLYKDYIELSLTNINNDVPNLALQKLLLLSPKIIGANFDFTIMAKNEYGSTPTIMRYLKFPTIFDLHKSKIINIDWQDNNVLGFNMQLVSSTLVQTPIVYTDSDGRANNFEVVFVSNSFLEVARTYYNANYTPTSDLIPYENIYNINDNFYTNSVINQNNFNLRIIETNYDKDPYEIPVFSYMVQGNDSYDQKGNIVLANDIFDTRRASPGGAFDFSFYFVISDTRFSSENALSLFDANEPTSGDNNRVVFTRSGTNAEIIDIKLYSTFNTVVNTTNFTNKNIGFYAVAGTYSSLSGKPRFLFAINDYALTDYDDIRVYINNWKI